jgi:diguanylate cyclase (GGDEF)-like protein
MDKRALSASLHTAAPPELQPVAVTTWTARLADAESEREFRRHRFRDDRRRALLLVALVALVSVLNVLGDVYDAWHGAPLIEALARPLFTTVTPLAIILVILRVRAPALLELTMVAAALIGAGGRMTMLTFYPEMIELWPAWMAAVLFIFYIYMPVRLMVSLAMAAALSIASPLWWWQLQHPVVPLDEILRGIAWLLLINALGFAAANSLQRSQRAQFAQQVALEKLLSTDALTGIANRRRFDAALVREWHRCARSRTSLSLLMIDVDHFKAYNDRCGHQQGDQCLRRVAKLLSDSVGRPGDLVARYGGEEFVCLLPEIGQDGARAVATRLIAAVHRAAIPHPASPLGPLLTVSIGVATATDLSGEPTSLFALADQLMYAAKNAGRNQYVLGELASRPRQLREARAA